MNVRNRLNAIIGFEPVDRTLKWEGGFFSETVRRWYKEGLPKIRGIPKTFVKGKSVYGKDFYDITRYFNLDPKNEAKPLPTQNITGESSGPLYPPFEPKVLEDHDEWFIKRTAKGTHVKNRKDRMTLPIFVSGPVQNRTDWEKLKDERLQPRLKERFPKNWDEMTKPFRNKHRDYPININVDIWRTILYLMGNLTLLKTVITDPDLIRDMANTLADLWVKLLPKMFKCIQIDWLSLGEDMCYKNGPFISPKLYREIFFSAYKRIVSLCKDNGVLVGLETDGDCRLLIPFFLDVGINWIYPLECTMNQNVMELRKQYPRLAMMGGINKKILVMGRKAIDKELNSKIPFMLEYGGYIPMVDHNVPPEVAFDNYTYYRWKLNEMIHKDIKK